MKNDKEEKGNTEGRMTYSSSMGLSIISKASNVNTEDSQKKESKDKDEDK